MPKLKDDYNKDSEFWKLRKKLCKNITYNTAQKLMSACEDYFKWVYAHPLVDERAVSYKNEVKKIKLNRLRAMSISALCLYLGITRKKWSSLRDDKKFEEVCEKVQAIIYDQKFTGAAADLFNVNVITRDIGLADKFEHTGKDGEAIEYKNLSDDQLEKRIKDLSRLTKPKPAPRKEDTCH